MTKDERSAVETQVKEALDYNYQTCEVEKEQMDAENATDDELEDEDKSSQDASVPMEEDLADDQKTSEVPSTTTEEKVDDGEEELRASPWRPRGMFEDAPGQFPCRLEIHCGGT